MALIGENCARCREAAEAEDGGGLAGRWWRGWANVSLEALADNWLRALPPTVLTSSFQASEQSGFIGAAIVGGFLVVVVGYYGGRWIQQNYRRRHVIQ